MRGNISPTTRGQPALQHANSLTIAHPVHSVHKRPSDLLPPSLLYARATLRVFQLDAGFPRLSAICCFIATASITMKIRIFALW